MNVRSNSALASVENALALLKILSRGAPIRLIDAAAELEVAPSTAHRLLATFEHRGFASRRSGSRTYAAGPVLLQVAHDILSEVDLARFAQPVLEMLGRRYHESVLLGVLDADGVRFIAGRESEQPLRVGGHFSHFFLAHTSAAGLVLLAELNRSELRRRYPSERVLSSSPHAFARRSELERELVAVRARGHALVVETTAPGVSAVAVPLTDGAGNVIAALTLIAPSSRYDATKLRRCVQPLRRAAARMALDYAASIDSTKF